MNNSIPAETFDAFRFAVIRLATYVCDDTPNPRLLFGSVSLLTNERYRPISSNGADTFPVGGGRQGSIVFRRVILACDEAIAWYRTAPTEGLRTPMPLESAEIDPAYDGRDIDVSNFTDDPRWPALGIPSGSDLLSSFGGAGDPAPFIGSGASPARIHRRLGDSDGFRALLDDADAIGFLRRRLHIDLSDYAEYLGALALVVPNPILRAVQHFFVPGSEGASERLVFRLIPRTGQTAEGLHLTVLERRLNLLSRFDTVTVGKSGLVEMNEEAPVEASGYVIAHPLHGVLVHQPPLHFIRSIKVTTRVVNAVGSHQLSRIGEDAAPATTRERVVSAELRRDRKAQAQRYEQIWVNEANRDTALMRIRSHIFRAGSRVLISVPPLRTQSFLNFLREFPSTSVPVTFIISGLSLSSPARGGVDQHMAGATSFEGVEKLISSLDDTVVRAEFEYIEELSSVVEKLKLGDTKQASAYIALSTRFNSLDTILAVDDLAWSLGGLFTSDAGGASLMMAIPDAEPVLTSLEELAKESLPVAPYLVRLSYRLHGQEG